MSPTFAFAFAFSAPSDPGAQLARESGGPLRPRWARPPQASPASRAGDSAALAGARRAVLARTLPAAWRLTRSLCACGAARQPRGQELGPRSASGCDCGPTARLDASLCGRAGGPPRATAPGSAAGAALIRGPAGALMGPGRGASAGARARLSRGELVRAPGPFSASLFHSQPRVPGGAWPGDACQAAGKSGGGGQGLERAVGVRRAKQSVQAGQGLLKPETRAGGCASPGVWEAVSLLPWTSRARRSPRPWDLGAPGVRGGARVALSEWPESSVCAIWKV